MIATKELFDALASNEIDFYAGVPDSLLGDFCAYIEDFSLPKHHVITANEGNAIALAAGYYLSSGKVGVAYMQNSGLGNAINPLASLTDAEVYGIPVILMIGWRGEPDVSDEPQHIKQGRITPGLLELLDIPYWVIQPDSNIKEIISELLLKVSVTNAPVALLVKKDAFLKYSSQRKKIARSSLMREEALEKFLELVDRNDLVIATTGKTAREIYEIRGKKGEPQDDFLCVGSMGHASSLALGVSIANPQKRVVCFDGDGALLMHLGALPVIGSMGQNLFLHIVLNNYSHESVGGQPTVSTNMDFERLAEACGYSSYLSATSIEEIEEQWGRLTWDKGPILFEVKIDIGSRKNLGRPSATPRQAKELFINKARASIG
jgi:phosphonopyruvate decarboxylase